MGKEIERKFLVKGDAWKALAPGIRYRQGYLNSSIDRTVRVRTIGDQGFITVKGPNNGIARLEFEHVIPADDANEMLTELAEKPLIEKNRYRILRGKHVWEVDEFLGENAGLVVAEIELGSVDEPFEKPEWIGGPTLCMAMCLVSRVFCTSGMEKLSSAFMFGADELVMVV